MPCVKQLEERLRTLLLTANGNQTNLLADVLRSRLAIVGVRSATHSIARSADRSLPSNRQNPGTTFSDGTKSRQNNFCRLSSCCRAERESEPQPRETGYRGVVSQVAAPNATGSAEHTPFLSTSPHSHENMFVYQSIPIKRTASAAWLTSHVVAPNVRDYTHGSSTGPDTRVAQLCLSSQTCS
jgi:hypothetical protein